MADVFEVLRADHEEVKLLLIALEESPGRSEGADEAVLEARGEVVQRLVMDSSAHEAAEERYFWPAVRQRVPKGDKFANEAISQESEAKEVLDKLEKLAPADPEFDELIAKFIPAAAEHWRRASDVALEVLPVLRHLSPGVVLNVNIPAAPPGPIKGIRQARLAAAGAVELNLVESTAGHLHVTMVETGKQPAPGTDSALLAAGYAVVTAIRPLCEETSASLPWPVG